MDRVTTGVWVRRLVVIAGVLAVALLVVHGYAFAEEGHEKAGLPQFNPKLFWTQLVWLTASFTVLYFLMAGVALPNVTEVLAARDGKIAYDYNRAEELKEETAALMAKVDATLNEARGQAKSYLADAGKDAENAALKRQARFDAEIASRIKDAELRIVKARQVVVAELPSVASAVAQDAIIRLVGAGVNAERISNAVAGVLKERAV